MIFHSAVLTTASASAAAKSPFWAENNKRRDQAKGDALKAYVGAAAASKVHIVIADVQKSEGVAAALAYIDSNLGGKLDHVVTAVGGGWCARSHLGA